MPPLRRLPPRIELLATHHRAIRVRDQTHAAEVVGVQGDDLISTAGSWVMTVASGKDGLYLLISSVPEIGIVVTL